MTRQEKMIERQRRLAARGLIVAAAVTENHIAAAWQAELTITADAPNPAAKLDNPDGSTDKSAANTQTGNNGTQKRDANGNPPRPRFNITAYNGGPMRVNGYRFPVVVDGTGISAASANLPIYVGHSQSWNDIQNQMEQLFGQTDKFAVDQSTGQIMCSGPITGESELCKAAQTHAANGFKFQASINAQPSKIDFVPEGVQATVNGRPITGPCVIARAVTCDHIALVPLGADTSTTAKIAAEAAKGIAMEFAAWLQTTYSLDAAKLTAEQKTKFEAEYAKISATAETATATTTPPAQITAAASTDEAIKAYRKAQAEEDKRISDVRRAAKDFPDICASAVSDGWSLDKTELEVLRAERKGKEASSVNAITAAPAMPKDGLQMRDMPARRGGRHTATGSRIGNEMAAVLECAALISAGYSADRLVSNPSYGQRAVEFADRAMAKFGHSIGPLGLMRLVASFAGVQLPNDKEEAYRVICADFSTLSLPVILSNVMNKFLLDSYVAVDPDLCAPSANPRIAWQQFTKRGPVNDFKPHYRVRLVSDLTFQPLGPTGEIQSGKIGEQSYTIQADTKAIMFGLSRKDIINDDLSVMSSIPSHFGRGAGVTVARFVYGLLIAGLQSDRATQFFTASASTTAGAQIGANLLTTASLSFTTLAAAEAALNAQVDPNGLPAGLRGDFLLVPPALKTTAEQLYQSKELITAVLGTSSSSTYAPQANTLAGRYGPVCSSWLASLTAAQASSAIGFNTTNSGSTSTWYLGAGPGQPAYPMEVGFLNGQEMPIVERDEADFNRLGIAFRGFIDFGGNLAEQRAIVKNTA